jgi:serine/threonine protein kinase/Tol biopolymer transport system component
MPLTAGTRLGPYEIVGAIGAGGMGEVYRARDTRLDRTVAIKVIPQALVEDPALRQRMEREARAISALDHPHICALYDVGRERPRPSIGDEREIDFLVMQHLEGETLAARLERGPLPLNEAVQIGAQIADALAAAHRRGIVHRDLKPGNVMLTRTGARLLDFGLAKQAVSGGVFTGPPPDALTVATPLTAERTIVGTLQYMAPEQLEGKEVDARTDLFALGAVLYEMVTGHRAFAADSSAGLAAAVLTSHPPPIASRLPLAPPALSRLVVRCLAKNPDDRWQSAADLAFELRTLETDRQEGVTRPRHPVLRPVAVALGLVAAGLAIAAALYFRPRASPRSQPELRLSILPPAGHTFTTDVADYNPEFALSPDGSHLAFTTMDERGERQLWVRALSAIEARPIAGTSGARMPFWSPDGRAIGYFGPGGLTRVPLTGGSAQTLGGAQTSNGATGSWGQDGLIIFERVVGGGGKSLATVGESGGAITAVSRGSAGEAELAARFPSFLPDGRHFIYLSWTSDPTQRAIYLGSLDTEARVLLVRTGFKAEYIDPGFLVFVRDRALVAQRLDLEARALVGEPHVLVEGLALEAIPGQSTFAASRNGVIAYRSRSREVLSELRWIDRTGRLVETAAPEASDITVSLSPDGRRALTTRLIASAASEERLPANIWLQDLPRRVATRVTLDAAGVDENPIWSPDGRALVFASHRGSGLADVRLLGTNESGAGRIIASGDRNFHPIDWSRDGKTILLQAYATGTGADNLDLWSMPADASGAPQPYLEEAQGGQAQGQFSPDGRWVAYTSDESGRVEVYVRAYPSGQGRSQVSASGGAQPRWRRDGRELYYVSPSGTLMAVPVTNPKEFAAGVPVPLFTASSLRVNNSMFFYGGAAAYDVDRDGRRFLVNHLKREPTAGPIHVVLNALPE